MLSRPLGVSERWACRVVGQHRSTQRHEPKAAGDDAALRAELRAVLGGAAAVGVPPRAPSAARGGLGGEPQAGAAAVARGGPAGAGPRGASAGGWGTRRCRPSGCARSGPNHVWAFDFQFDQTADGRVLKLLNIVDEFTREALEMLVERSIDADSRRGHAGAAGRRAWRARVPDGATTARR